MTATPSTPLPAPAITSPNTSEPDQFPKLSSPTKTSASPKTGRPPTPIGHIGKIRFSHTTTGKSVASAHYRNWDDQIRRVSASGADPAMAEVALRRKLTLQGLVQPGFTALSADSSFASLVDYWRANLHLEEHPSPGTVAAYEAYMRTLVLPAFGELPLLEIGVARCDYLLKRLTKQSHHKARHARVVLHLVFQLAVRHEIIPRNPIDHVSKLRKPPSTPQALTPEDIDDIRAAISAWENRSDFLGPKPDRQLGQLIETLLGTSARIGEALAIRIRDIELTAETPTIHITGTLVCHPGVPVRRQDHPKTARSRRRVALSSFTAEALQRRLAKITNPHPNSLLFSTRSGTPIAPNNIRRLLRAVLEPAGITGVTPHSFRRTAATTVYHETTLELSSKLLGHSNPSTTITHYVQHDETVTPVTAEILDRYFANRTPPC